MKTNDMSNYDNCEVCFKPVTDHEILGKVVHKECKSIHESEEKNRNRKNLEYDDEVRIRTGHRKIIIGTIMCDVGNNTYRIRRKNGELIYALRHQIQHIYRGMKK